MDKVADPFGTSRRMLRAEQLPTQCGQAQAQLRMAVDQDGLHEVAGRQKLSEKGL